VQVARELVEALLETELTLLERVVRLFLISDVVHNSGSVIAMANAWCYRREFEAQQPETFERLHSAYRGEESRVAADKAGDLVMRVLRSWQTRAVFSSQFVKGLEVSFFRDIVSADNVASPDGSTRMTGAPEAIFVKLAEWRSQHFSQLEKLAKARGLNWQTMHLQRPADGRTLEQVRTAWLLDRLVTYELHVWETKVPDAPKRPETIVNLPVGTVKALGSQTSAMVVLSGSSKDQTSRSPTSPKPVLRPADLSVPPAKLRDREQELLDEDIDGESLSSDDEALLREQEPSFMKRPLQLPQQTTRELEQLQRHTQSPPASIEEQRRLRAAAAALAAADTNSVTASSSPAAQQQQQQQQQPLPPPPPNHKKPAKLAITQEEDDDLDLDGVPVLVPGPLLGPGDGEGSISEEAAGADGGLNGVPVLPEDLGHFQTGSVKLPPAL